MAFLRVLALSSLLWTTTSAARAPTSRISDSWTDGSDTGAIRQHDLTSEPATSFIPTGQIPSVQKLARAQLEFSLDLYRAVALPAEFNASSIVTNDTNNLIISPYSVVSLLSMLYLGSNGDTASQLQRVLHLDNMTYVEVHRSYKKLGEGVRRASKTLANLTMANQMFVQRDINVSRVYAAKLLEYYDATMEPVDFATEDGGFARKLINAWVRVHTRGRIDGILGSDPPASTTLLLANAVYYHGQWLNRFERGRTFERSAFHVTPSEIVHVPMMVGRFRVAHGRLERLGCEVLELPYADRRLSMLVFLPDERDGLRRLEERLTARDIRSAIAALRSGDPVNVRLPRFELESQLSLRDALTRLGLDQMFLKESADFSGMTNLRANIYVDQVTHRTTISVNEDGSEAAAASALDIERSGVVGESYFEADRPFLFCIWDYQINVFLFIGRLVRPAKH